MGDLTIDEPTVRSLLDEQHPDLAELELREVIGGWDNRMWRLGRDLAVRLPRTERAPSLLEKEHRWVPALAANLPIPVSVPVRLGEPTERFGEPWLVTTWVSGEPADTAVIDRGADAAKALGGFLAALHEQAPADAPTAPDRGVPLGRIADQFESRFNDMESTAATVRMRRVWDEAVAAPEWDGPRVWLHGDLHPANAVVADGTLAGIVDFGDLCTGDPATDLAAAWMLLPDGAAARCFEAYGRVDEATVRRARGWALVRSLSLIDIGRAGDMGLAGGKPTWRPAGEAAIDRLLASLPARTDRRRRRGGRNGGTPRGGTAIRGFRENCSARISSRFVRYTCVRTLPFGPERVVPIAAIRQAAAPSP